MSPMSAHFNVCNEDSISFWRGMLANIYYSFVSSWVTLQASRAILKMLELTIYTNIPKSIWNKEVHFEAVYYRHCLRSQVICDR